MKVLHIFNSLMPSGAETMWLAAAPVLKQNGVETDVLATSNEIGPYAHAMKDVGFGVYQIPHKGKRLVDLGYSFALYKFIREKKYDAVQIHPEAWRLTNVFIARVAGVKKITTTIHSIFQIRGVHYIRRVVGMWLIGMLGGKVVAIGDSVLENECKYHHKPLLIYNWIDAKRFASQGTRDSVRHELGIADDAKIVMLVGNCAPVKNHEFFFRAFALLPQNFIAVHVGRENEAVYGERALAMSLGISDRVRFLGARDDVPRLLEGADVFVMTSLLEGLGLSCLEAMIKGLPAVVTDVPGLRDLAKHIPLCEKTVADDERIFAGKICEVAAWTEDELWHRKEASNEAIKERFDIKNGVNAYIDMWSEVRKDH